MVEGTVVLLGCGNMGAALIRGAVAGGVPAGSIRLVDTDPAKIAALTKDGIGKASTLEEALPKASTVIFAVKPQVFPQIAIRIGQLLPESALCITIMAGVAVRRVRELLGRPEQRVARLMPNLPLTVGAGASAVAVGGLVPEDLELVRSIFKPTGALVEVPESQLDAVTGLSGSAPAYVLKFLMALEDGDMRDCGLGGAARPCFRVDHIAQVWKSRGAILCFGGLDYRRVHDGVVVFGCVELACGADDAGCIPMVRQRRRKVGYDGGEKEARACVSLR